MALRGVTSHPTAIDVYDMVKADIPKISLGTVYRNLNVLRYEGEIISFKHRDGTEHFDGNAKPHLHLTCETCGAIVDLPQQDFNEMIKNVQKKSDCEITSCQLMFYGKCAKCATIIRKDVY